MGNLIVSVAGVRGVVGDSLTPTSILPSLAAFGGLMQGKKVVVGGDGRPSFEPLQNFVNGVLTATGCKVIDVGVVPTPTVGMLVREFKAAGGIMITASHNPAEWNGLKFFNSTGTFFDKDENAKLAAIRDAGNFEFANYKTIGTIEEIDTALEIHMQKVLDFIGKVKNVRKRRIKVAIDCVNGAGSVICPALIKKLGCQVVAIHQDVGRPFPRKAEPLPQNLRKLSALVKAEEADVGFGLDPDGDRLAIVDETGRPIGEERTLVLGAHWYLTNFKRSPLVANLSTSRALEDVAWKFNVDVYRTAIGEINVVRRMQAVKSRIGGEGNGGAIVPEVHPGRDASTAIAIILTLMRQDGRPLSEINKQYPDYAMLKDKVGIEGLKPAEIYKRARKNFADAKDFDTQDGLKIIYNDSWVHVRPSGTEPILRIFAEAPTPRAARILANKVRGLI